jgi:hypothetical protein
MVKSTCIIERNNITTSKPKIFGIYHNLGIQGILPIWHTEMESGIRKWKKGKIKMTGHQTTGATPLNLYTMQYLFTLCTKQIYII